VNHVTSEQLALTLAAHITYVTCTGVNMFLKSLRFHFYICPNFRLKLPSPADPPHKFGRRNEIANSLITRFNLTSLGQPLKPDIVSLASWLKKRRDSYKKVVAMS
jgi:hypothetical protein